MVDELSKKISLNKSQKKEVSDLFTAHFNEVRGSMNNNERNESREEMDKKRRRF